MADPLDDLVQAAPSPNEGLDDLVKAAPKAKPKPAPARASAGMTDADWQEFDRRFKTEQARRALGQVVQGQKYRVPQGPQGPAVRAELARPGVTFLERDVVPQVDLAARLMAGIPSPGAPNTFTPAQQAEARQTRGQALGELGQVVRGLPADYVDFYGHGGVLRQMGEDPIGTALRIAGDVTLVGGAAKLLGKGVSRVRGLKSAPKPPVEPVPVPEPTPTPTLAPTHPLSDVVAEAPEVKASVPAPTSAPTSAPLAPPRPTSAPTSAPPPPSDVTGVAKAITERAPMAGTNAEQMLEAGRVAVESQKVVPTEVAARVMKSGEPMSAEELAAVGYRLRQLENRRVEIAGEVTKTDDPLKLRDLNESLAAADAENEHLLSAADLTLNTGFHKLGMAAQIALKRDYTLSDLPMRAKAATLGTEAPEGMMARVKQFQRESERLAAELKAAREEIVSLKGQQAPSRPRARTATERDVVRIRQYFGATTGEVKPAARPMSKQAGAVTYTIPKPEMEAMQAMRRLARDVRAQGAGTLDEVVAGIRNETGLQIPEEQVLRMVSDKYRNYLLEADVNRLKANGYLRDVQRASEYRLKTPTQKALSVVQDAFNTTQRSFQAGMDLSAPFIQGRKGIFADPAGWMRAWKPMLEAMVKGEDVPVRQMANIERQPLYARSRAAGLELTEPGAAFTKQEEVFAGNLIHTLIQKLPGSAKTNPAKLYLQALENSEAAYTTFLNAVRWDTFQKLAAVAPDNPAYLRDVASTINTIYGRGAGELAKTLGKTPHAGNVMYAPRYTVSAWEYATGRPIRRAETALGRKAAMKIYAAQAATYGSLVVMARMAGWSVDTDPRSTSFGTVTAPNGGQVDLFGKEAQAYRLVSQVLYGRISEQGKYTPGTLYEAPGTVGRYVLGKASPGVKTTSDALLGKLDKKPDGTYSTHRLTGGDLLGNFMPLWIQSGLREGTFSKMPGMAAASVVGLETGIGQPATRQVPLNYLKPGQKPPRNPVSVTRDGRVVVRP